MKTQQEIEAAIVRSLKTARMMGAGQPRHVLESVSGAYSLPVSNALRKLKRQRKITFIDTTRVWYWIDEVNAAELIEKAHT